MSNWSYLGRAESSGVGTPQTVTLPATQAGDLLIYSIVSRYSHVWTPPAGWTEVFSVNNADSSGYTGRPNSNVGYIIRGAGAPANTWTRVGGDTGNQRVVVVAYRPASGTVSYVGAETVDESAGPVTTHTKASIVGLQADDLIAMCMASSGPYNQGGIAAANDPATASPAAASSTSGAGAPTDGAWTHRYIRVFSGATTDGMLVAEGIMLADGDTGEITWTGLGKAAGAFMVFRIDAGGSDTITVNEPTDRIVYEGAGGSANVTISGSHTGATSNIEVQIERTSDSSVAVAWTTLASAVAEGPFSGSVTVPKGGWYIAKVRKSTDLLIVDASTNTFGVGLVVGGLGQSHLADFAASGTGSPSSLAVTHNGTSITSVPSAGAGQAAMLNALVAEFECPVMWIQSSAGGTNVSYWYTSGGGATANYTAWADRITASGGELSAFVWWQGDFNTLTGDSKASYTTLMSDLVAKVRADFGATYCVVGVLGRKGSGTTDAAWQAIRSAHVDFADNTDNFGFQTYDMEQGADLQHFTDSGRLVAADRIANCLAAAYSLSTFSRGPVAASAEWKDDTVDVTLTHDGATDISPAGGQTGWMVLDDGTPITVSSAVRRSATKSRLTLASTPAGTVTVRYAWGAYPDVSGVVVDNSALALPLRPTDADITATYNPALPPTLATTVSLTLTTNGTTLAASLTGLTWAFFDEVTPDLFGAPVAQGLAESTDGSGVLVLDITGTSLVPGAVGWLIVTDSDGTTTQDPAHKLFSGPVVVS